MLWKKDWLDLLWMPFSRHHIPCQATRLRVNFDTSIQQSIKQSTRFVNSALYTFEHKLQTWSRLPSYLSLRLPLCRVNVLFPPSSWVNLGKAVWTSFHNLVRVDKSSCNPYGRASHTSCMFLELISTTNLVEKTLRVSSVQSAELALWDEY